MDAKKMGVGVGVAAGALGILAALAAIGLVVVYSGAYNVAATEEHMSFTRWAFDTTFHNSVERRAADLAAPQNITPDAYRRGKRLQVHVSALSCRTGRGAIGVGERYAPEAASPYRGRG